MALTIDLLPPEIIFLILSFLPEDDHILLLSIHPKFKQIMFSDNAPRALNLSKGYLFKEEEIRSYFYKSTYSLRIKKLDLSNVWWLSISQFVIRCKNLKVLHLHGSKINFGQVLKVLDACPQICDLAIDVTDVPKDSNKFSPVFFNVITLSIYLIHSRRDILKFFPRIEYLYLHLPITYCDDIYPILKDFEVNGKELYVYSKSKFALSGLNHPQSYFKQFHILWGLPYSIKVPTSAQISNIRRLYLMQNLPLNVEFPLLEELVTYYQPSFMKNMPSLKSCHYLVRDQNIPLQDMDFLEILHSHHPKLRKVTFWCPHFNLNQKNFPFYLFNSLEYLCTSPNAMLIDEQEDSKHVGALCESDRLFKKPRIGQPTPSYLAHKSHFNRIFDSCPLLRILEIGIFKDFAIYGRRLMSIADPKNKNLCPLWEKSWQCLENISKLSHVTHLTLDSIPIRSGEFFVSIAKGCPAIKFLRLTDLGSSAHCCFMSGLCEALPLFQNLSSFRLQQKYIFTNNELFTSLSQCSKLSRVAVLSITNHVFKCEDSLTRIIHNSGKITFLWICIGGGHYVSKTAIKRMYSSLKKSVSKHMFFRMVWHPEDYDDAIPEVPFGFYNEMLLYKPWIFHH